VCWNCECSFATQSSHNTDAGSVSVQVMLKLPTGETVACSMPAIVIMPSLSSTVTSSILSQSITSVPSPPMQLIPEGNLSEVVSYASQTMTQPSLSLNSQAPLGLHSVVSSGIVTSTCSQPGVVFDLQESGLTALGIAASTREVCGSIDKSMIMSFCEFMFVLFYIYFVVDMMSSSSLSSAEPAGIAVARCVDLSWARRKVFNAKRLVSEQI